MAGIAAEKADIPPAISGALPPQAALMMNNSLRVFFVFCFLAFDASVIWYCLLKGDPSNALHTWSNTAAWTSAVLVGAGIGILSVSDSVIQYLGKKP